MEQPQPAEILLQVHLIRELAVMVLQIQLLALPSHVAVEVVEELEVETNQFQVVREVEDLEEMMVLHELIVTQMLIQEVEAAAEEVIIRREMAEAEL